MPASTTPTQTVAVNLVSAGLVDTVTIASAPDGSTLVFGWGILTGGQAVTPSCPNTTWTVRVQGLLNGTYQEIWTGKVSGGASGTTVTFTAASSNYSVLACKGWIQEWRGYDGVGYVPLTNSGTSVTNTLPTLSPASGKAIAIIGLMRAGGGATWSGLTAGWTDPAVSGSTLTRNVWLFVASSTGTYSATQTMSSSNAWTSAGVVLYEAPAATFSFTTQPPASATSGAAMATVVVTADAAASGLTCTLTLVGPNGSVTNNTAVCNGSGVATFTTLTPTADGPGYTLTAAIPGYTGSASTSFTVIGPVVAANQAFVTAMGGDSKLFNVHDPRIYGNGALASIPDTIGPIGGRAAGITCSGTGVTVASGKMVIASGSSPDLESAADARLVFTDTFGAPRALWDLVIAEATGTGPLCGISANPTSATANPKSYVTPTGSTWQVSIRSDGASPTPTNPPIPNTAGLFTNDSGVAFAGGAIRAMAVGRLAYQTASLDQGNNINYPWGYLPFMAGKQPRFVHRVTAATAGNCKLAYGRDGATFGNGKVSWRGQYTGDWTLSQSLAFIAFARAEFGATVDIVAVPSLAISGNSLVNSTTQQSGGDMQQPTYGSGTTSFPYYMANKVSGARGSLVSQGLDVAEVHSFAYGRSGGDLQYVLDTFDVELALLADGTRTGPIVIMYHDIGNSLAGGGMTQAQFLAASITLKGKCDTLASTSGRRVRLVPLLDPDRVTYYNASWSTIPTGYSANGTDRVAIGVAMLAAPSTYGYAVYDCASTSHESIGTFAAPKCYSTTYFNITANGAFGGGDATHQAPLGYQEVGEGIKAFLDANDGILYPPALPLEQLSLSPLSGIR